MIKYFAWAAFGTVEPREVLRETENSVYLSRGIEERRKAKRSDDRGYFDTWREARDFLLEIEESKIAALTGELARRQAAVERIKEMKE
jgi:hypothetical protein